MNLHWGKHSKLINLSIMIWKLIGAPPLKKPDPDHWDFGRGIVLQICHLGLNIPQSLNLCTSCWSLLITISSQKKLLWCRLRDTSTYGYNDVIRSWFGTTSIWQNNNSKISRSVYDLPSHRFLVLKMVLNMGYILRSSLKFNQKVSGYHFCHCCTNGLISLGQSLYSQAHSWLRLIISFLLW